MGKFGGLSILLVFTLFGCSAAFVPYTSDPSEKLEQAYALMDDGRPLPAERLIDGALSIYQEEGKESGMADAYYAYGILYQLDVYFTFPRFTKRRVQTKEEAVGYLQKALNLYIKNGLHTDAAKTQFEMGRVYWWVAGKKTEACAVLDASLESYNKAKELDPSAKMPFRSRETDFSKVVQNAKQRFSCDKSENN